MSQPRCPILGEVSHSWMSSTILPESPIDCPVHCMTSAGIMGSGHCWTEHHSQMFYYTPQSRVVHYRLKLYVAKQNIKCKRIFKNIPLACPQKWQYVSTNEYRNKWKGCQMNALWNSNIDIVIWPGRKVWTAALRASFSDRPVAWCGAHHPGV